MNKLHSILQRWMVACHHLLHIGRFSVALPHPWAHRPRYFALFNFKIMLLTTAISSLLYFGTVGFGAYYIYQKQQQNGITKFAESIFPYPATFINGQIIYLNRFRREVTALTTYAHNHQLTISQKDTERHVATQLINRALYSEALQKEHIVITSLDLQKALDQIYQNKGGQDKLALFLEENYGPSMSLNDFRLLTQDSLTESAIQHQLLTQVKVRHILIALPTNPTDTQVEAARQKALEVKARVSDPSQFAEVAKDVSDDVASRDKGGDLGTTVRSPEISQRFSPEFEQVLFTIPVGTVSDPIRSRYGWHIILVEKREGKIDKSLQDYTNDLRTKAKIRQFVGM